MENMEIYEAGRAVPKEAQKQFNNGRFQGTDINPMWRIKKLTELFGPAGIGWYYDVVSERSEQHGDDVMAIVDLKLYVKTGGEWSKPIYGTGGNILLQKGRMSDEGYKMALTDALSVACKALGIGADIYFGADKTKYTAASGASGADQQSQGTPPVQTAAAERRSAGQRAAERVQAAMRQAPAQQGTVQRPGEQLPVCAKCGRPVTPQVATYSQRVFGKIVCYGCQSSERGV